MNELKTRWGRQVTPENVWKEYPRPSLVRRGWKSLNGLWEYAFTDEEKEPEVFDGQILVPFSPEASLSGVGRQLKPDEWLWYRRNFSLNGLSGRGKRILLHFGAVDQTCTVYVNGRNAGSHQGGYLPFTLDITELCRKEQENQLLVKVCDVSDTSFHSRGKQKLSGGGMFYTAQSGIWQTVWLESVPETFVQYLRIRPDYDGELVKIKVGTTGQDSVKIMVLEQFADEYIDKFLEAGFSYAEHIDRIKAECIVPSGKEISVDMGEFTPWTPDRPHLYGLLIQTGKDLVLSYFAMRKCDIQKDSDGVSRIFLNNRPYFQAGLLDQGYWPDGLYTAPCDEAFIYDIELAKSMGFQMLRKHVKIEQERWYYHCDRLGMLVWQDMVNGGGAYKHWLVTYLATVFSVFHISVKDSHRRLLSRKEKEGRTEFLNEVKETIKHLYNHPSIVCYVPFNEGWGQFEGEGVTKLIKKLDNTRLVDQASGWFDQKGGDLQSIHSYFFPFTFKKEERAAALTEFGGYSLKIEGHCQKENIYGYRIFKTEEDLADGLERLMERKIHPSVKKGICATVYTQLSDVEEEINGLVTYDREVVKVDKERMRIHNERLKEEGGEGGSAVGEGKPKQKKSKEKRAASVAIIGGSDGPTSIFLAGRRKKLFRKLRVKRKQEKRLRLAAKEAVSGSHTTKELGEYIVDHYHGRRLSEDTEEYREARRTLKGNLVLREKPELVGIPEPEEFKKKPGREQLEVYCRQVENRIKAAEDLPDHVIPMEFSRYRIILEKNGEEYGDITVDMEEVRQLMSVSYSYSQKEDSDKPKEIMKDIYRFFGVSKEDIENHTERFLDYAMVMKGI